MEVQCQPTVAALVACRALRLRLEHTLWVWTLCPVLGPEERGTQDFPGESPRGRSLIPTLLQEMEPAGEGLVDFAPLV